MPVTTDVVVIGAGPAGLAAALSAARYGASVLVIDANLRPGGQLIKQIHKFFGSREHRAGVRGMDIAQQLHGEAVAAGARVWLDSQVYGVFHGGALEIARGGLEEASTGRPAVKEIVQPRAIVLCTGASENALAFPGWTLPGVMGAGAAQTMINVERVLPGRRVLMVGSGNVGLIVSYQLMQAGAEVVAVVEAARRIGGYAVHAVKVSRAGVPILTSHTVARALGLDGVRVAEVVELDSAWNPVAGTEKALEVDTICIATGLRPYAKLATMAGCEMAYSSPLGGWVPVHGEDMMTSVPGLYVAGDVAGVEEASTAMEEGRLAGLSVVEALGLADASRLAEEKRMARERLRDLRIGPFGQMRSDAKQALVRTQGGRKG
ncbi:MAG: FAD-dependent oxidoreductase [Bacillota bacterium]|nr:FAD-dependent oxidoreductase [Bacillota bacterium]